MDVEAPTAAAPAAHIADTEATGSAAGASGVPAGPSEARPPNAVGGDALILNKLTEIQHLLTRSAAEAPDGTPGGLSLRTRSNKVAFSIAAQSLPFVQPVEGQRLDAQSGRSQQSGNAMEPPLAFGYAPSSLPPQNMARSEARDGLPLTYAYAPVYASSPGNAARPPVIASNVPLTFAYGPALSSLGNGPSQPSEPPENHQVPYDQAAAAPSNAAGRNITRDVPLRFAYSPPTSMGGQSNAPNLHPTGNDIPLAFAYAPAMSLGQNGGAQSGIPSQFTSPQAPYPFANNRMHEARANELPITFAYAPASSPPHISAPAAMPKQAPRPRYRFAFGPPFSDPRDASRDAYYWPPSRDETPVVQAQQPAAFPPTTVTIPTTPDPPPAPPPKKTAPEKKRSATPQVAPLSREKVYVEEITEHNSSEASCKEKRRFVRDRRFKQTEEDDVDEESNDDEDEEEEGEEDEDYDYNAIREQATRNRRRSYEPRPPPRASRRKRKATAPVTGRQPEPFPTTVGVYPAAAPYYMHQAQVPLGNFYQPMAAMFPPLEGYQPSAPMMQPPPPVPVYQTEQPQAWANQQQLPQPASAPPQTNYPDIGVVHTEEQIKYECIPGQSSHVQADNRTVISTTGPAAVSRVPAQQDASQGDGRAQCVSVQQGKSQLVSQKTTTATAPMSERRLQLTPNVALKISKDVEDDRVTASQADRKKEVEIKITEQVLIAMKGEEEAGSVGENTAASSTQLRVETPGVVAEARSEVELVRYGTAMPDKQKGDKSPPRKTHRNRPEKKAGSEKGTPCCRTLSPCFQTACHSKPGNSGQEQPSFFSWIMNSCAMDVPSESSESSSSDSSEEAHEMPERQKKTKAQLERKRNRDMRLQRLIKLERMLREKMAKNPELRKMLPEEEFLTKKEAARMQEREEREAAAVAVQQRDEAAQTVDAAQADLNILLKIEAELKAELAKLQCILKEPPSAKAMVEDGREKLKRMGEVALLDRGVFESPIKERAAMRDFAVDVHCDDIDETPSAPPPSPDFGCSSWLSRPQVFGMCQTKGTQASLLVESSTSSEGASEQGLYFVGSRKVKDGGLEILLSTQHKKESNRGDHTATTAHQSSSFIRSYNERRPARPHMSRPKNKGQREGVKPARAATPETHQPSFKHKASQTTDAQPGMRPSRLKREKTYTEFSLSTEESSDTAEFTFARTAKPSVSRSKRKRDDSVESVESYQESRRSSVWPRLSSVKITTRPSARVHVFNKDSKRRSTMAPASSKPSTRLLSTRETTRTSTRAATTISSTSNASPLSHRKRNHSVMPTSRCSYYEQARTSRSVSPRQRVRQGRCTWQQLSDGPAYTSVRSKPSCSTVLVINTAQISSDQPAVACSRNLRESPLEPHLLEREDCSQKQQWDQPVQRYDKPNSSRAHRENAEEDKRQRESKQWEEEALICHQQYNDTGQGDLTAALASRLAEIPERQTAGVVYPSLFAPEQPAALRPPEFVQTNIAPEPAGTSEATVQEKSDSQEQQSGTANSTSMSRATGKSSYGTPAQSIPSYSFQRSREPRVKRVHEPQTRRSHTEAVVYFLLLLAAIVCLLAVVDLFASRGVRAGNGISTNQTVAAKVTTRKFTPALQRPLRGLSPCHDFYSSACFKPTARIATDVAVVRHLEDVLLQQHDSPLRTLWEECVNASQRPDAWAQFRQLLATVSLEGWPFSRTAPARPPAAVWEAAAHLLRLLNLPALASLSVWDHPEHQGKFIVTLEPPSLLINSSAASHNWSVLWHTRAAGAVLSAFGLEDSDAAPEVTALERHLAQLAEPPRTGSSGRVERMAALFRFRHFVAQSLHRLVHVTDSTEIWLREPSFVQGLLLLLDESSSRVPLNYLGFRVLVRVAPFLPAVPGDVGSLLALHLAHGRALELDTAHACLRLAAQAQPHLALLAVYRGGRELFDRLWRLDFAGRLRAEVEARLQRSAGLLDAATRTQALRRLRRLEVRVFFPAWVRSPPGEEPLSSRGLGAFVEANSRMTALRQAVRPEARWLGSPLDGHCSRGSRSLYVPASLAEPSLARLSARASACLLRELLLDAPPPLFQRCFPSAEVFIDAAALPVAWEVFQATRQNTSRSSSSGDLFFSHFAADLCQWRSRVILPLSSSSEFRSTFNCSRNDAMAKLETCAVWGS